MYKSVIRPLLFNIDPEHVHEMLFSGLKYYKNMPPVRSMIKKGNQIFPSVKIRELEFKNRIGLAAGFDKGAEVFHELADFGFGFIEIGTVTPSPQKGNPKPRIFRLAEDESLISRTGFNNPGIAVVLERIKQHTHRNYLLGANINRDPASTGDALVADFLQVYHALYPFVDYFTINWGSIEPADFDAVLQALDQAGKEKEEHKMIFIKLPADIPEATVNQVIELARNRHVDGFIASGPTMDRSHLPHLDKAASDKIGAGGVSGKGIGDKSKKLVRYLRSQVKNEFLIIGAGGIITPDDAIEMMKQGADLIQIYSAFIFSGPKIVDRINRALHR